LSSASAPTNITSCRACRAAATSIGPPASACSRAAAPASSAPAATPTQRVLINLVWRGGLDQHSWFPLLGNPKYKQARPTIAETEQTSFALSRGVGAINEFKPLYTALGAGGFGYVPAADSQDRSHSHFTAADLLEGGMDTPSSDGWAARALKLLPNPAVLSAVMVGGTLPKSLAGSSALTLDRIESFGLNGGDEVKAKSEAVLQRFYSQYKDPVAQTALETLGAIKTVRGLSKTEYKPAVEYPQTGLAQAFKTAAQLIKAKVGLRFVNIDMGEAKEEVSLRVIGRGVGAITENDVNLAIASDAVIVGFNVRPEGKARESAEREGVDIRYYTVIYQAIEEIEAALKGLLKPEFEEVQLGTAEVREVFRVPRIGNVAGSLVRTGLIRRNSKARLIRDGVVVADNLTVESLKRFKDDATEVRDGYECGIGLGSYNDIKTDDVIETFELREKPRT